MRPAFCYGDIQFASEGRVVAWGDAEGSGDMSGSISGDAEGSTSSGGCADGTGAFVASGPAGAVTLGVFSGMGKPMSRSIQPVSMQAAVSASTRAMIPIFFKAFASFCR